MSLIKIIQTEDGSQSLYNDELNETYHSTHGALTESMHVFIKHGLDYLKSRGTTQLNILEVGFGTGLNVLLTQQYALESKLINIKYSTLEPFPISQDLIEGLNYSELLKGVVTPDDFLKLHQCEWSKEHSITSNFNFTKYKTTLQDFVSRTKYDLIFYDAFAPSKQSEMWDFEVLKHLADMMNSKSVLVTYCARGQFKRDLDALGLQVETLPGPPGKKEMVRGTFL